MLNGLSGLAPMRRPLFVGAAGFDWSNLVAYWPMDESSGTREESVGSIDLSENGGTINSGTGLVETSAADLTGSEDLRNTSGANDLHTDPDFSFVLWLKPETLTDFDGFFNGYNSNTIRAYYRNSTTIRMREAGAPELSGSYSMSTGVWHMLAVGYTDGGNEQYITMAKVGTDSTVPTRTTSTNNNGRNTSATGIIVGDVAGNRFDGLLGPMFFFGSANGAGAYLSNDDLNALYNGGSGLAYA
jgi:hypothetical protein